MGEEWAVLEWVDLDLPRAHIAIIHQELVVIIQDMEEQLYFYHLGGMAIHIFITLILTITIILGKIMKNFKIIIGALIISLFGFSNCYAQYGAYMGNTYTEYYDPYNGWYNAQTSYQLPRYPIGTYSYYGGGMFGNSYFGPTPFQRDFYGIQNGIRIRVGPNFNHNNVGQYKR